MGFLPGGVGVAGAVSRGAAVAGAVDASTDSALYVTLNIGAHEFKGELRVHGRRSGVQRALELSSRPQPACMLR